MGTRRRAPFAFAATAVAVAALALAAFGATAQSVSRGAALYTNLGCDAANCHGSNPAENLRGVLNGAGSPGAIEYAAVTRTEMNHLFATFISDQTAAQDLAAWLATITPAATPPATTPPTPPAPAGPTTTVGEYFHAQFGHYLMTGATDEIAKLDSGEFAGWARTGLSFKAYAAAADGLVNVCRFFTVAFAPKSSHFYTPVASECAGLRASSNDWQYEGDAFHVPMPDAAGTCPSGTAAVYRLYNAGQGGAPNHRYTTQASVRNEMIARAWRPEGYGPQGVIFCSPP